MNLGYFRTVPDGVLSSQRLHAYHVLCIGFKYNFCYASAQFPKS